MGFLIIKYFIISQCFVFLILKWFIVRCKLKVNFQIFIEHF